MIFGGGLVGLLVMAFWLYCIFDVLATDDTLMRNAPKGLWVMLVIFLPTVGGAAWLLLGRPENAGFYPGGTSYGRPPRRVLGPDDSPEFLAGIESRSRGVGPVDDDRAKRLEEWEAELRRREEELRRREEDGQQGP